jgi:hypothetical protein
MADRCTPDYERALAKMGAWLPYRRAQRFLSEFFPLGDDPPWHETVRRRTTSVGAGLERETLRRAETPRTVPPSETMTVSINAGHVRAARGHQGRTFEVIAARVSNDDGQPVLFSGVPGEADQQHTQLNGVMTGLGITADTEVTILSDDTDSPRSLGEAASSGTVFHVLDWFHLAMRVQHAAQCASGWSDATARGRRDGARFADAVEHIRWRLWHGQTVRALRLIQRTLAAVEAKAERKTATARSAAAVTRSAILGYRVSEWPAMASKRVRFVGEIAAMAVADTRAQAEDLAELVEVGFEELPAITNCRQGTAPGATLLHEHWATTCSCRRDSIPGSRNRPAGYHADMTSYPLAGRFESASERIDQPTDSATVVLVLDGSSAEGRGPPHPVDRLILGVHS